MGNSELQSSLGSAITRTLEDMTFDQVEIDDEVTVVDTTSGNDHFWATLPVKTPLSGKMVLEISSTCAKQLAKDIYGGSDGEYSDKIIRDVLAEVLNTIAGNFIKELVPNDRLFEIGLPTSGVGNRPKPESPITRVRAKVGVHYLTAVVSGEDFQNFESIQRIEQE
ncbi:chemotaxis protein CheX [bacterium]|nr:chemotaxis protein CheX [bacterium]